MADDPITERKKTMRNKTSSYHEGLADVVADVRENWLNLNRATSEEFDSHLWSLVPYGQTRSWSFRLDSLLGRGTRSYLQMVVFRMPETGRYELVCYGG